MKNEPISCKTCAWYCNDGTCHADSPWAAATKVETSTRTKGWGDGGGSDAKATETRTITGCWPTVTETAWCGRWQPLSIRVHLAAELSKIA